MLQLQLIINNFAQHIRSFSYKKYMRWYFFLTENPEIVSFINTTEEVKEKERRYYVLMQ